MMDNPPNPNDNPKCGSKISIVNPLTETLTWATVVDTCVACGDEDIDVSEGVFENVVEAGLGVGRVGVWWGGSAVGGRGKGRRGLEWVG